MPSRRPALVSHFIEKYGKSYGKELRGLAPGTLNALLAHDWPGNVRELENVVERAVVLAKGTELTADDLPPSLRGPRPRDSRRPRRGARQPAWRRSPATGRRSTAWHGRSFCACGNCDHCVPAFLQENGVLGAMPLENAAAKTPRGTGVAK